MSQLNELNACKTRRTVLTHSQQYICGRLQEQSQYFTAPLANKSLSLTPLESGLALLPGLTRKMW